MSRGGDKPLPNPDEMRRNTKPRKKANFFWAAMWLGCHREDQTGDSDELSQTEHRVLAVNNQAAGNNHGNTVAKYSTINHPDYCRINTKQMFILFLSGCIVMMVMASDVPQV